MYYNEFGYHVGTKQAAEDIIGYKPEGGKVMKLYTKLGKTIRTPDIFGKVSTIHDYIYTVRGEYGKTIEPEQLEGRTSVMGNTFPDKAQLQKLHELCVDWKNNDYDPTATDKIMQAKLYARADFFNAASDCFSR